MQKNHSLLCGYSYAYQVGYKPQIFEKLEKLLLNANTEDFSDGLIKDAQNKDLIEQIIDSYGKLGFLFYSLDRIKKLKTEKMDSYPIVYYYAYNFIYDCKAFLDAIAVLSNNQFNIGASGGDIDFHDGSFQKKIIEKKPELCETIRKYTKWFNDVVKWRIALIHKYSTPICCPGKQMIWYMNRDELDQYTIDFMVMIPEPQPYLSVDYTKKKKGEIWEYIDNIFNGWIGNACDFYEQICDVIATDLS